jgi:hypothetical protein
MRAMSDEPRVRGWLPPRAPGAQVTPRFEPVPEEPPAPAEPTAPEPPPASGWQPPVAYRADPIAGPPALARAQQPRASGLAITAIVLGALGIALLLLSFGTWFPASLLCSGAAWACGIAARNRADADPAARARGPAHAAVVIGMVGVGLGIAAAVIWIVLISAGVSIDDLRDWLDRRLAQERR